jgi:hypothetical protein
VGPTTSRSIKINCLQQSLDLSLRKSYPPSPTAPLPREERPLPRCNARRDLGFRVATRPFRDHLSCPEKSGRPHLGVRGSGASWSTSCPPSKLPRHRWPRSAAGEGVFMEDDELGCACFTDITRGCILQLLSFADAVAVSMHAGDASSTCSACTRGARRCAGRARGALHRGRRALFNKDAASTPALDDFGVGDVLVHLPCGHRFR